MLGRISMMAACAVLLSACGEKEEINSASAASAASASEIRALESKMTACAAGRTVSISAGVKVDLVEAIKGDVDFSASARDALVGAVFEDADISDPNVLAAYQTYESCLRTLQL